MVIGVYLLLPHVVGVLARRFFYLEEIVMSRTRVKSEVEAPVADIVESPMEETAAVQTETETEVPVEETAAVQAETEVPVEEVSEAQVEPAKPAGPEFVEALATMADLFEPFQRVWLRQGQWTPVRRTSWVESQAQAAPPRLKLRDVK